MAASEKLARLRHLLAERFPAPRRPTGRTLSTGFAAVDDTTGGLSLGAVTEIVCAAPSCGSQLFVGQLLAVTRTQRMRAALIDAADAFDPDSFAPDLFEHLVWVRCQAFVNTDPKTTPTRVALHAADLLARDANLSLVILDLRHAPEAELRRIPGPQWYRFQRAIEPAELALVVLTPRASVPCAQLRLVLSSSHTFQTLSVERHLLASALTPMLHRQRLQTALSG